MDKVLLVLHLMIAAGLVGVVLLQRSEGGGLGMGSSSGGFMTGRGTANLLTRTTAALAAAFFATSIALTLLARHGSKPLSPLDLNVPVTSSPAVPGAPGIPPVPAPAAGGATPLPQAATPVPEKAKEPTPAPKK